MIVYLVIVASAQGLQVTEIINGVSRTVLDPLRSSPNPQTESNGYEITTEMSTEKYSPSAEPQNIFTITKYDDESSDFSSTYSESSSDFTSTSSESTSGLMRTISDLASSFGNTFSGSSSSGSSSGSSYSTNTFSESSLSTDPPTSTTETDEILEMTSKFHKMRVNLVNFNYTIHAQQKVIAKLAETIRGLENDVTKLKLSNEHEMNKLKAKNENCRLDYNLLFNQLRVAKKLFAMEKYSDGLKRKLSEFGVDESSNL